MVLKNFVSVKRFELKKFYVWRILGQKKFWFLNNFGSKKIWSRKNVRSRKFKFQKNGTHHRKPSKYTTELLIQIFLFYWLKVLQITILRKITKKQREPILLCTFLNEIAHKKEMISWWHSYIYMGQNFITPQFWLLHGAKSPSHVSFCTFFMKANHFIDLISLK